MYNRYRKDSHQAAGATRRPFLFSGPSAHHQPAAPPTTEPHTHPHERRMAMFALHPQTGTGEALEQQPAASARPVQQRHRSISNILLWSRSTTSTQLQRRSASVPGTRAVRQGSRRTAEPWGRLGRAALPEREGPAPEAQAGSTTEGSPRGALGRRRTHRADGLIEAVSSRRPIARRAGTTRPGCTPGSLSQRVGLPAFSRNGERSEDLRLAASRSDMELRQSVCRRSSYRSARRAQWGSE